MSLATQRLVVNAQAYYDLIIHPSFADLVPDGAYSGTLGEFTVMDDVTSKKRIIDAVAKGNVFKRRDASCKIDFTPVGKLTHRSIETDRIYGATMQCDNEFYTGCLTDFINQSETFRNYILTFFKDACKADTAVNSYFGDIGRAADSTGTYNWNSFDGIFKKYAQYIADGTIPSGQTFSIASGAVSNSTAYNYLVSAFNAQPVLLKQLTPDMKAYYVSNDIFWGYHDYLVSTGGAYNIRYYTDGIPDLRFKGIRVLLEPTWSPVIYSLTGSQGNACILTLRGNFLFATDKTYGGGANNDQALRVWFSEDEEVWKYVMHMKAGTEIMRPDLTVIGTTSW